MENTFISKLDMVRSIRLILSESYKLENFGFRLATLSKTKAITLLLRSFGIYEMHEVLDMTIFDSDITLYKFNSHTQKTVPAINPTCHLRYKSPFNIIEIICKTICEYPDDSDMLDNINLYLTNIFKFEVNDDDAN
jgi:hypothetical protein